MTKSNTNTNTSGTPAFAPASAPLSPEFQAAVQAVQEADMLLNSEYEPLNVHIHRDKENTLNAPLSTRSGLGSPLGANRWVDRMVKVANACNSLVVSKCNMCHVYANRQVEFEASEAARRRAAMTPATSVFSSPASPTERVWQKMNASCAAANSLEVNLYRQFLFDEESVVGMLESALDRVDNPGEDDDDDVAPMNKNNTQQTQQPDLHFV
jgi:hypothetical protein